MLRISLPIALGAVQAIAVVAALAIAPLVPPARGMMLLAPILGTPEGRTITLARDHDATIVGAGAWPGSIVVEGRRSRLVAAMARAGILVLAAPATACGEGKRA